MAGAGRTHSRMDARKILVVELCRRKRFAGGGENRVPDQVGIKSHIGPSTQALSEEQAARIAQSRPALRAAAIEAKKQGFVHDQSGPIRSQHPMPLAGSMPLNIQFGKRRSHLLVPSHQRDVALNTTTRAVRVLSLVEPEHVQCHSCKRAGGQDRQHTLLEPKHREYRR